MLAVAHHCDTIHENIPNAGRELMRLFIRCVVNDRARIEHGDIGVQAFLQQAAILNR